MAPGLPGPSLPRKWSPTTRVRPADPALFATGFGREGGCVRRASETSVGLMDLERFVRAQDSGGTYQRALTELRNGRKTSHWMWFIFPQIAGLGRSAMAQAYAISDLAEAQGYLAHPVLGPRLVECAEILASHQRTHRRAHLRRH